MILIFAYLYLGRTTITVAHRLSTIKNSDTIYVISSGKLVEQGSHEQLMGINNGLYSRLVEAQGLKKQTSGTESGAMTPMVLDEEAKVDEAIAEKKDKDMGAELARRVSSVYDEKESLGYLDLGPGNADEEEKKSKEKKYGVVYLFFRMAGIVRDEWYRYAAGAILAARKSLPYFACSKSFIHLATSCWIDLSSFWSCVRLEY
jgi:ATP-binding cassette subfamily B (MDR/TAP) protein 1